MTVLPIIKDTTTIQIVHVNILLEEIKGLFCDKKISHGCPESFPCNNCMKIRSCVEWKVK